MSIKPLSKETINLIKSTHVIKSICSSVKELVENSLDGQSRNIEVNLVENGLSLIEVKDNGIGISKEDAKYMALPSYTSKISDFNDLGSLTTYGFRGEGLTAVCQVSEVTVSTKTAEDEIVNCYTLDNEGHIISSKISHGLKGTTVQMKNLFKNMPVRRNILNKKESISKEIKDIKILLKTYALCKPLVRFIFRVNNKILFEKPYCSNVSEALRIVIGMQIFVKLISIEKSFNKAKMQLFIPKKEFKDCPQIYHADFQFLCVNDRPIRSEEIEKKINKRISEYFDSNSKYSRKYVFCLILKVEPSMLDVNLEPNKDKIFLQNKVSILEEIDNVLFGFYGLQDSQMPIQNVIESINAKGNLNKHKKEIEKTKGIPATKKRKIDGKNVNDIIAIDQNILNIVKNSGGIEKKLNYDFLNYSSAPILDDSDLNEEFKKVYVKPKEKQKFQAIDVDDINIQNSQNFDFMPDFLKQSQVGKIEEERLSKLLVVNLREDFNCNELEKQKTSDLAWSKGQVTGLQGGVSVAILNHANLINFGKQNNQMQGSEMCDNSDNIKKIGDNELNSASNENNIQKFHWNPVKNAKKPCNINKLTTPRTSKRKSVNSSNPTITPVAGDKAYIPAICPTPFAMYCKATRVRILKDNPEFKPSEVANQLNEQWKQTSMEEREYYHNLAKQQKLNESNNPSLDYNTPKKPKLQLTKLKKKLVYSQKLLVNMLGNMKSNKADVKNESIIRTHVTCDISIDKVAEKFKKFVTKELPSDKIKKPVVIGALNTLLWIVNLKSSLYVFDIKESHAHLHVRGCNISQINVDYVERIVDRLLKEKNNIFNFIYSFKNTN